MSGEGIASLIDRVTAVLSQRAASAGGLSRARHRDAVQRAVGSLETALHGLKNDEAGLELVAEALRDAMHALERLVGRVDVEDVLERIFGSFCIGK